MVLGCRTYLAGLPLWLRDQDGQHGTPMVTLGAVTDPVDEVGVEEEKNLFYSSRAPVRKDRLAREKQTGIS